MSDRHKKHTVLFDKFCKCVDQCVNNWSKADKITPLEQREHAQRTIYGIVFAALYVLTTEEYFAFVNYVHEKGFDH